MKELKPNEANLINEGKTVVDFYADWCGPCKFMKPYYEKAEKDINALGVTCYEVNVDECEDLASKNRINFIPCVIFYENGVEKDRFTGGRDTEGIMEFIRKNTAK